MNQLTNTFLPFFKQVFLKILTQQCLQHLTAQICVIWPSNLHEAWKCCFSQTRFLTEQNESSVSLREEEKGRSGQLAVSTRGLHNHTGLNPRSLKALGNGLKEQKKMRIRCRGEGMGYYQGAQLRWKRVPALR